MRKVFDIKCHCDFCLRFCEPPDDAKVQVSGEANKRVDLDDQWLLIMGCEVSKYLNTKIILPLKQTVFDQNYNQRKHLKLKEGSFTA